VIQKKTSIEELQVVAARFGGKCLSARYDYSKTKYLWECQRGHRFRQAYNHVKEGHWCPACAGNQRGTLEEYQRIAEARGGRCLSRKYVNAQTKLTFRCVAAHVWQATPNSLKNGTWCKRCAHLRNADAQRLTLGDLRNYAASRGGKCLAMEYHHRTEKLPWRCGKGHTWLASAASVYSGKHWCPTCGMERGTRARLAEGRLGELRHVARERGGQCLSTDYAGMHSPLRWECATGHQFASNPSDILRGGWCPECGMGLGERICREYFQQLFGQRFPRTSPTWLFSDGGTRMHLDGYAPGLRLAFEHHGRQHYEVSSLYTPTRAKLRMRRAYDRTKRRLCKDHGITLIEVPEVPDKTPVRKLRKAIAARCRQQGVTLPADFFEIPVRLVKAYAADSLEALRVLVRARNGKLVSKRYRGAAQKLLLECSKGHRWWAVPSSVKAGRWCRRCAGTTRLSIALMQAIAAQFGGTCLSKRYRGVNQPLRWKCAQGHPFDALPTNVRAGHWCPVCAGVTRGTLDELRVLAASRGGRCLSKTYHNAKERYLWECRYGHRWETVAPSIKRGSWCRYCAGKIATPESNLEKIYPRLAAEWHPTRNESLKPSDLRPKSGKLVWWRCRSDPMHEWQARVCDRARGRGCPECWIKRRMQSQ